MICFYLFINEYSFFYIIFIIWCFIYIKVLIIKNIKEHLLVRCFNEMKNEAMAVQNLFRWSFKIWGIIFKILLKNIYINWSTVNIQIFIYRYHVKFLMNISFCIPWNYYLSQFHQFSWLLNLLVLTISKEEQVL